MDTSAVAVTQTVSIEDADTVPFVPPDTKLYVIVRADLPPGAQAAQGIHAAQEWAIDNHALATAWRRASGILAFLSVPDVEALYLLHTKAAKSQVGVTRFCDDDLDQPFTAITLEPVPAARMVCRGLGLALKDVAQKEKR